MAYEESNKRGVLNRCGRSEFVTHMQQITMEFLIFLLFSVTQTLILVMQEIISRTLKTLVNTGLQGFFFTQNS